MTNATEQLKDYLGESELVMKQRSYHWPDPTGMWLMVEHWLGDYGKPRATAICGRH